MSRISSRALSPSAATDLGQILAWQGRLTEGAGEFTRALELEADFAPALLASAAADLNLGRVVQAQSSFAHWLGTAGGRGFAVRQISSALGESGSSPGGAAAGQLVATLPMATSGQRAAALMLVGDHNGALDALEDALEDHTWVDQFLAVNTLFDPVRNDPRFIRVVTNRGQGQ